MIGRSGAPAAKPAAANLQSSTIESTRPKADLRCSCHLRLFGTKYFPDVHPVQEECWPSSEWVTSGGMSHRQLDLYFADGSNHAIEMRKIISVSLAVSFLFAITYFMASSDRWFSASTERPRQEDPSFVMAHVYAIQPSEIPILIEKAAAGDCHSAGRLGAHYLNYQLDPEEALKWYRVAARCQEVYPKDMVIILLYRVRGNPAIDAEIDRLILEVQAIDPTRAEEILANVKQAREEPSKTSGSISRSPSRSTIDSRAVQASSDNAGWTQVGLAGKRLELVDPLVVEILEFTDEGDVLATLGTKEAVYGPILAWKLEKGILVISSETAASPLIELRNPRVVGHPESVMGQTLRVTGKLGGELIYKLSRVEELTPHRARRSGASRREGSKATRAD